MVIKCPKCGQDNLDIKIFCGFCGAEIRKISVDEGLKYSTADTSSSQYTQTRSRSISRKLGKSRSFGLLFPFLPLLLLLLSLPLGSFLCDTGDITAMAFTFGFLLFVTFNLFAIAGLFIFNNPRKLRFESIEGPFKFFIAFLLCVSLLFVCIFGSFSIFDNATEYRYHEPIGITADQVYHNGSSLYYSNIREINNWRINTVNDVGVQGSPKEMTLQDTLFYSSSDESSHFGVVFNGASDCLIANCIFFVGVSLTNCHNITINNCIFPDSMISLQDCQDVTISYCTFYSSGYLNKDGQCSDILEDGNSVKEKNLMPEYSDYQFPIYGSALESVLVILFIIWLFLFGWLKEVKIEEY